MSKIFLLIASASGLIATGLGAFGAHVLKSRLEASNMLNAYQTAVSYQFYHTLALLGLGLVLLRFQSQLLVVSSWAFAVGILLFSGSLYVMCFTGIRWLGAITPLGGAGLILGWILMFFGVLKAV